jgi:hypothetical protein
MATGLQTCDVIHKALVLRTALPTAAETAAVTD